MIEEGAYADILIIYGNPLEEIMAMTEPRKYFDLIMKNGRIYKNTINTANIISFPGYFQRPEVSQKRAWY